METSVITAFTEYSFQLYRNFVVFNIFKGKYSKSIRWVFFIVYPLFLCLVFMLTDISIPVGVWLGVFYLFMLVNLLLSPHVQYNWQKGRLQGGASFTFEPTQMTVEFHNPLASGTTTIRYEVLYKVYETKGAYYVFLDKRSAYIVSCLLYTSPSPRD